jgi:uncharacterized protein YjbJ (UPF0337 family)
VAAWTFKSTHHRNARRGGSDAAPFSLAGDATEDPSSRYPTPQARGCSKGNRQMVNKDQVSGLAKQAKGSVKEAVGKATGSKKTEAKGKAEKVAGKVQKGFGDAKEKIKKAL